LTDVTERTRSEEAPAPAPDLDELLPAELDVAGGVAASAGLTTQAITPGRMAFRRFMHHKLAVASFIVLMLLTLVVLFAPYTARYHQEEIIPGPKPGYLAPGSRAWFGTDSIGHDLYSRVVWGGRVSLSIGIAVALASALIGTAVGAIAGYRGGLLDDILMRVTDLFLAFPLLVALLVLRNLFNEIDGLHWFFGDLKSVRFMIILLALVGWMGVARIVRGVVLSMKEREFIEAARAIGSSDKRIVATHLIPNALGPIIVAMTTAVAFAIITESTLSYFGYGVDPAQGKASWGNLIADSRQAITAGHWWIAVFPCLALVITVLCVNFIGDGLRDAFDPKQQKVRA
jgi:peptide/nickel transport system permease protein